MLKLFRNIRQNLLAEGKTTKYLKYAIGEIVLVVIGILIALQINNWNENQKSQKDEYYVLSEVLKNLEEDALLVDDIITQRQKAKTAVITLQKFLKSETRDSDSLQFYLVDLLTFERYFPINNAYEILKSKGLQLSNNELTTKISRYYDYEQPQMSNSILDIEVTILKIFNDRNGLVQFLSLIEKDVRMVVKDPENPIFIEELTFFLMAFQDNNGGTLEKLLVFRDINKELREQIANGLIELN
ncbi:hypothetical protein SAMN03097699_0052 [Flavobacteriaceae bacterium MAR_2010_188]|nr:hypothetical protein SAMN03097699_0052 [Flavobacteriaceae bacterium MAR_2010_188]